MSDWPPTYGDTTAEYLAARDGRGRIVGQSSVLWVEGPDAVGFLQGIISQDVEVLQPGEVAQSLLLEPRGKLTDAFWVLRGEEQVGIVTTSDHVEATRDDLARWKIRIKAELRIDDRPVQEVWGRGSAATVAAVGLPQPAGWVESHGVLVAALPLGTLPRIVVVGGPDRIADTIDVGQVAATAVRIEAGAPRIGVDIDDSTIPQEAGLVDATVSFTKGCYLGQELVARIDTRGRVNRHLRGVVVSENIIPPVGAVLIADGRDVGALTSVGESLEVRAPVGLALVRREVEPGDSVEIRWDGGSASGLVRSLPLAPFDTEA